DAMLGGGRFSITAGRVQTERGQCVEIGLADTGHGMSEEVMRRAFEPFYTTKPADSGTGLGLSVVRDLAENAGGMVEVVSTPGSGTLFRILLPLAAINQSDASSAPAAATETPGSI
ncbi:MAG TPA: ATP-binding protein, partial [Pseudoxanthomonas sp.]|nr:ATP-binding protein [Pseudoxanthomonas sp.]